VLLTTTATTTAVTAAAAAAAAATEVEEEGEGLGLHVLRLDPFMGGVISGDTAVNAAGVGGAAVVGVVGEEEEELEGALNILYTSGSTGPPKGVSV
jgi:acyl-CoA synthetase (AMP-forming)/AMP-acid ligase II